MMQHAAASPRSALLPGWQLQAAGIDPGWPALHSAWQWLTSAHGMQFSPAAHGEAASTTHSLSLHMAAQPALGHSRLHADAACASESALGHACGLGTLHARARTPHASVLPGSAWLSALAACNSLSASLALASAQLRSSRLQQADSALSAHALLGLCQYLADARLPAPAAATTADRATQGPPFISSDGVYFELETLEAEDWRNFCVALQVAPLLAEQSWHAFMQRYAKACAPLPLDFATRLAGLPLGLYIVPRIDMPSNWEHR